MSFDTTINKVQYDGNDATTVFSFPYLFQANGDLAVIHTNSDGVDTTLVLDTNYSVSGAENPNGGSVTYPISGPPLATGETLTIIREMDITQETDLSNHGAFFLEALENAMDKVTMVSQQLKEMYDRTVKVDITDTDDPPSVTDYNTALATVQALENAFDNLVVQNHSAVATAAQTDFTMPGAWPDLDATSNVTVYDDGLKINRDDYTVTAPDQVVFDTGRTNGHTIIFELHEALSSDDLDAVLRNHQHWNSIDNGGARVAQGVDYTLVKDAYSEGKVDGFFGMATGTAVTAGILTQKTNSALSRTGFSVHFSGVTLTGTGILYLRHRISSEDAKQFKNRFASFVCKILHDVGSVIDYTVFVRKADSIDDFSAVTEISNSGALSKASGANLNLNYENINMGDCSNGVEIEIKIEAGAITTKNFEITELQLEDSKFSTTFDLKSVASSQGQHENFIINGCARVFERPTNYTLVKDTYDFGVIDRFEGMATGTLVTAGVLTKNTSSSLTRTGNSIHFDGVTLTGTGIIYLRHRIEAQSAKQLKNQFASFSAKVLHDVGSAINYTVFLRKADAADNFGATTEIANSGALSVASGANANLKFVGVPMGDCSNGIEIEIKIECGAITTKDFEMGELQFELGNKATEFQRRSYGVESELCQRFFEKGQTLDSRFGSAGVTNEVWHPFKTRKRTGPTMTGTYTTGGGSNVTTNQLLSSSNWGWQSEWAPTAADTDAQPFVNPWYADAEF